MNDITGRDRSDEALRESEARFRSIYEHAAVGIEQVAPDGRLLMVNAALCRMLGYAEAELLGRTYLDLTHPDDRARVAAVVEEMVNGERDAVELEKRYLHRDGSSVWVHVTSSLVKDGSGGPLNRILVVQDITGRKRVEEALQASQERLAAIIGTAMDAIVTLDQNERVVLFNAAAERIFGCPASGIIGKPIDRFLPERFRGAHGSHIREFGATGKTSRSMSSPGIVYGVRANGEEFPIEATISHTATGGQMLYTVILRDVTQKKKAEEVAALYAQSKELDRVKTEVFANISHELRTPLALILGLVRARLAVSGMADEERRDLEVVDRNAGLLLRHVNDILDLSKLDAGHMNAAYLEVDLAQMVRLAASYFENLAEEAGIAFAIQAPGPLTAQIDPPKIERSLLNLLSNAFKFTPAGGRVSVRVQAGDGRAILEVEDTGPGLPPPMREAIFERFRQLDSGSARHFGGTGLGLSIAKQFVNLHGGSLTVEDPPGGTGSLFRMELPLRAPDGAIVGRQPGEPINTATDTEPALRLAEELRAPRPVAQGRAATHPGAPVVLLVEDNRDMSGLLSRTLGEAYRVIPAFDGQEGYDKALQTHPDLILCDIMMPRMSGGELVRKLRGQREFDDVPIVLLTARADEALQVRLLQEGAQDYLYKPVVAQELLAKVARLIADRARVAQEMRGMRDLSEYLFQLDDQERKEVARELHENTAQSLAAVELNLAMVQDSVTALTPDMQRLLTDGIALLQSCVGDIQTSCFILYPSLLEHFGLKAATEAYVRGFAQRSGIQVTTEISAEVGRLAAECEVSFYRVMQEALRNVSRHSGSRTAILRIFRNAGDIALEVSDQGCGTHLDDGSKGIGIRAMRERMRNLGGRLDVVSGSGGTTVRAVAPAGPLIPKKPGAPATEA